MQFKKGVRVDDAQGKHVGTVEQVVIEPSNGQISHVVVHTGHLMGADKVVPVDNIRATNDAAVSLNITTDEVKALPDLVEVHYIPLNDVETAEYGYGGDLAQPVFWYPFGGPVNFTYPSAFPGDAGHPFRIESQVNMPKGTVALAEGAKVYGKDGKHVGDIEEIIAGNEKEDVTALVITKGAFNQEKKMIPANWISKIMADEVQLSVNSSVIDRLEKYQ